MIEVCYLGRFYDIIKIEERRREEKKEDPREGRWGYDL